MYLSIAENSFQIQFEEEDISVPDEQQRKNFNPDPDTKRVSDVFQAGCGFR